MSIPAQVTLILATEFPFVRAILDRLGGTEVEEGPLSVRGNSLTAFVLPKLGIIVARGKYGLIPATVQCAGFHSLGLYPSLVVQVGTAGYTGDDLKLGSIVGVSSCHQWDADVSGLGFEEGDFPGVDKGNSIPTDFRSIFPKEVEIRPLFSGSSFVDHLPLLPSPLRAIVKKNGRGLVDMEGYGVDFTNREFGVDGLFLRHIVSNNNGAARDLNLSIQNAAPIMAQHVHTMLNQLGRC